MNFLLSLFFAVLVSSTVGLLSLPLRWVFLMFRFNHWSFAVGLLLRLASSLQGRAEVVSARLNPSQGTTDVRRVYAPRFCLVTAKIWRDGY